MTEKLTEQKPSYQEKVDELLKGYQVRNAQFSPEVNMFMNEVFRCLVAVRKQSPDETLEPNFTRGIQSQLGDALDQRTGVWEPGTVGEFLDWLTYLKKSGTPPTSKPPTSYLTPQPEAKATTNPIEHLEGEALRYALDAQLRDAENIEALATFVETLNKLTEKNRLTADTGSYYASLFRDRFWPIFEAAAAKKLGAEHKQHLYNLVNKLRSTVKLVSVEQQRSLLELLR